MSQRQPWIGLVEVRKLPGCTIIENKGAFVNVIAMALSAEDFEAKVRKKCDQMFMFVEEIENLEPFANRIAKHEVADELRDFCDEAEMHPDEVFFGTFHEYLRDDA